MLSLSIHPRITWTVWWLTVYFDVALWWHEAGLAAAEVQQFRSPHQSVRTHRFLPFIGGFRSDCEVNRPYAPFKKGVHPMDVAELVEFVRAQRKRVQLTQVELAELAGVSDRFLRELEKGKPTAEVGKVMIVLATLGYNLAPQVHRGDL